MKKSTKLLVPLLSFAVFITLVMTDRPVYSETAVKKPKSDNCITSKCHSKIDKHKYVHGPIAAGACIVCHGEVTKHKDSPKRNKFGEIKDVAKACYSCHEKFKIRKFTHTPVEDGECASCHSPHGSEFKFQLLKKGGEICFECHDSELVAGKFVHGPAAVGGCVACHEAHTADYEMNLKATGPALCFTCHTDKAESFQKSTVKHKPVTEDCIKCHNPHSAEKEFMLSSGAPQLCFGCHDKMSKWVTEAAVKHGALSTDKSCLNCHDAHVSNVDKNLLMPPMDLCMSCHNEEKKKADGRILPNMKKLFQEAKNHHGPIKQKDCSGCHNTHGSANFRILREAYPSSFYIPFKLSSYGLCFSCHEKSLVLDPETTKLTEFRNGKINLHFKHVNKPEKGRTCRSCHETHASNYPKHIREGVPFGSWELPINFEKTNTGGNCTPGCHKNKKYDRNKEVKNL